MQIEEMRLDGNAVGGSLREVFAQDMTAALASCAGCGAAGPVGTLVEYGQGMGIVLRCPQCEAPVLRIARARGLVRLDLSGVMLLTIPESAAVS